MGFCEIRPQVDHFRPIRDCLIALASIEARSGSVVVGGNEPRIEMDRLPIVSESFLVLRAEAQATIGENTYDSGRIFYDFQETDGILYPTRMEFFFGEADLEGGTIEGVEFDVEYPPNHFVIPDSIQ